MNLKLSTVADNAAQVQIDKEDYSIADIVHKELLGLKHVKFAGVPPPHPLLKTLTIQVHTDGTKPSKALVEAVEIAQERVADLLKLAREIFPQESTSSREPAIPKEIEGDELTTDHVAEI
jgi:DNA-directed RNA polymerase subunit L